MLRYMTFIWNTAVPAQFDAVQLLTRRLKEGSSDWQSVFDAPGLRVFYANSLAGLREIYPLADQQGVVVGDIFERNKAEDMLPRRSQFDAQLSTTVVSSKGRHLIDSHWGNYVAFLCSRSTAKKWVMRAPAGHLPCLKVVFRDVHVYCSLLHDVDMLNLLRFPVDWNYVAVRLVSRGTLGNSGLVGVSTLRHGECHELQGGQVSTQYYWDLHRIASTDRIEDSVQAARQLRQATRYCVHAWASKHESILLHLSGGLDSSIVLSCLADAPTRPTITAVTFYSDGPCEDERIYARTAAECAKCKLIEWRRNPRIRYEDALCAPLIESSRPYHRSLEDDGATQQIAAEHAATAIFSGTGGDQIFFSSRPRIVMIDYVYNRGIDAGLLDAAWTAAYLEQRAIWRILGESLYRGFIPHWHDGIKATLPARHFLTKKAVELATQASTIGGLSDQYVPEGKQRHILAITRCGVFYDPIQPLEAFARITPLISQPLVEQSLRIPTYVLTAGGRNRALARFAFEADIPKLISRHYVKGRVSKYISNVVWSNRDSIRELLCGGVLVGEGLVDQKRLAHLLEDHPSNMVNSHREVTSALCLEIWLRRACALQQRAAA